MSSFFGTSIISYRKNHVKKLKNKYFLGEMRLNLRHISTAGRSEWIQKMKRYHVIYADPPWHYRVWSKRGNSRSAEAHYPTMRIEEIRELPISQIAERDAVLFLWVTFPLLQEAWGVMEAWGFTFKTVAFVWIKQNRKSDALFWGMGYWTRANAEICLLATRGRPSRAAANVHQVILSHIEEHSKKPDEVRKRIERLMGDRSRIELFARQKPPGWDVWGDEVESDIDLSQYITEED